MKVLMLTMGLPPASRGGTEVHVMGLARALRRRGDRVVLACRESAEGRTPFSVRREALDGFDVYRMAYDFHDATSYRAIHEHPSIDAALEGVVDAVAPDVVHIHHFSCLSTSFLDRLHARRIPTIVTLHDHWLPCPRGQRITPELEICETLDRNRCATCLGALWPHFDVGPKVLEEADARLLRRLNRVDLLIAPSEFHARRMIEWGLDPALVRVVVHGLESDGYEAVRRRRSGVRVVGFLGSVIPSKGVHVLIEAWKRLGRSDIELVVHGEAPTFHGRDGYVDGLRAACDGLRVRFAGAYEPADVPRLLRGIDVLVVPPVWWESFCLTAREAFLAGVPVVASGHGALLEAFEDGNGGRFFPPGDVEALAATLADLIDHPERHEALAASVPAVRSIAECADETSRLYASVAAARRHREALDGSDALGLLGPDATATPYCTVFIPTWNGLPELSGVLAKLVVQRTPFPFEILVIDSGSTDGTLELLAEYPSIRVIRIPNSEFNHGTTRNRGVAEARGEIVALLTQDAEPVDDRWLARLVGNFSDPRVAGVYCSQRPRPDCDPFARDRLKDWTAESGPPVVQGPVTPEAFESMTPWERYLVSRFDDVASCVRKSAMVEVPYARRQFGEDVEWGKRAVLAGWKIVNDPGSVVIHSHTSPVLYEFKRVYLDHQNLHELFGLHTLPRWTDVPLCAVRYFLHLLPVVWRDDRDVAFKLWWTLKLPLYAFTQNLAQWLGAKSVAWKRDGRHRWVDALLRKSV